MASCTVPTRTKAYTPQATSTNSRQMDIDIKNDTPTITAVNQGHCRQNAERRTNAVGPVILRRKGGTALTYQRCHAVLGLDGLLFQKLIFPHRRAALPKQHNGHSHQHQQRDHPQAARQIVVQTKQPELTHRTQRQQRNGANDAERRRQRHLRARLPGALVR